MSAVWAWFLHWTGSDNTSGVQYGFWSGFGSDLGEGAILFGLYHVARARNCHVRGCWRFQWRKVPGTDHLVCRKHHPNDAPTHAEVLEDHRAGGSK